MPEALFWGYDEPGNMPGDARVDFFYITTYLNTAFLMQSYRLIPERLETISGFGDLLKRAMTACTGRGFAGHGYDNYGFVEGIQIFASVHTKDFIRTHGNLVPEAFVSRYYPGIKHAEDPFWVRGELYDVNDRGYDEICRLEGNGSLYQK